MFEIERPAARRMNREMLLGSVAALIGLSLLGGSAIHFERAGKTMKARDVRARMDAVLLNANYEPAVRDGLMTPGAMRELARWDAQFGRIRVVRWTAQSCGVGTDPCRFTFRAVRPRREAAFVMTVRGSTCWRIDPVAEVRP
ncbi:MAG: hypothetical protein SFX74_02865 [Fimbriimonadaceae bacterium]|nr:hypothetical protein [Fimbriimonadaceae bacterium]